MTAECSGRPLGKHRFLAQRVGRTGLHAGAAGHAFGGDEILVHAGNHARFETAALDGQRERALHLFAGAHAARADDALRRVIGEIGVGLVAGDVVDRQRAMAGRDAVFLLDVVAAPDAVADLAQADRLGDLVAIRCRRSRPCRSSRADDRRRRAPSRRGECHRAARSACAPPCLSPTGVVQEAGVPPRPSISTRQSRQEPNASSMSVAQSFGISIPASIEARMIEVPSGTVTELPSIVSVTAFRHSRPACRSRFPGPAI